MREEEEAIKIVIEYERKNGREPKDVRDKKLGYDIESSGRIIEVKARDFPKRRFVYLTQKEFETFLKNKNSWLYIVTPKREVIEISRDKVLKVAKLESRWRISLKKEVTETDK